MVESNKIEVRFTRSKDNYADILTKNVTQELFDKHSAHINKGRLYYDREKHEKVMKLNEQEESSELCYSIKEDKDESEHILDNEVNAENGNMGEENLSDNELSEVENSIAFED